MTWSIRSLFFAALASFAITAPQSAQAGAKATYPIVIKHAFGTTTIEKKPERIVTVAWANHEVPLALGCRSVLRAPISVMTTTTDCCPGWQQS